ncbi:MAG: UvrB/UvrC motif-containing protein [Sulfitobacter sp.]|nr:UvrB/UvrC motif-containing protein [Sulfitobacter sp.]
MTEVKVWEGMGSPNNNVVVKTLCEACAQQQDLPFMGPGAKASTKLWQLMGATAKATPNKPQVLCPGCGMGQMELRKVGRLGCPQCYDIFNTDLQPTLERIHGAVRHKGRLPGNQSTEERDRMERIQNLRTRLETAIQSEQFEVAADLRDELGSLETPSE